MSVDQHRRYNALLNDLMEAQPPLNANGSRPSKIKYEHLYLVDEFYGDNDTYGARGRGDRVSRIATGFMVTDSIAA